MTVEDGLLLSLALNALGLALLIYGGYRLHQAHRTSDKRHNVIQGLIARAKEQESELASMHQRFDRFDRSKDKKRGAFMAQIQEPNR